MRTRSHTVALVVFEEVELLDLAAPLQVLSAAGRSWNFRPYRIVVAAPSAGLVSTRNQLRVEATTALAEMPAAEIVWIAGGYGARRLTDDPLALGEIARLAQGATLTAAVGWGVGVLAAAGCIGSRSVASSLELDPVVRRSAPAAQLSAAPGVIADGPLLTVANTGAALELALTVVRLTMGAKLAEKVIAELALEQHRSSERIELKY
ncbi:MAG TPA: DJ-1/PfpI family protein [Polyangiaceae bacterium]|nr:DJ-1/PfpI family protein [Polyangiaceae bacterium]